MAGMSGGIDFQFMPGSSTEVVVVTEVEGRPVVVAGTDGSAEAVEAAKQVAVVMGQHLGRSVGVFIDVSTATCREISDLRDLTARQGPR